ncbi:MAG: LCP family protein [Candidatus Gastranaerophilales bacterium]|nr:LCP family protein [Candidatus Gastranaerophilales bacterium]
MTELKDKDEQYKVFLKYKDSDDKHEEKVIITLKLIFITFFVVALAFIAGIIVNNSNEILSIAGSITGKTGLAQKPDLTPSKFNFGMLSRYQNILLLGVDSNGPNTLPFSGVRSDTMIILSIDVHGKSVNAISIPRDSKVYLAEDHGIQKINAAYAIGGIDLAKKTIEETLGIKIHNYIIVNAEGVRQIIDALGGVPIHIDQNMRYTDYSGKLNINFRKGDYILDGKQSEEYLRFRKDTLGDIGRVHRQQKFLKALIERIKAPETLRKLPEVLKIANLYSRTDLNLYQMSQYASIAREIDLKKVEFIMLPGSPNQKGIISYWILDPEKTQQVIDRLIYRKKFELTENDISIGLMYSRSKEIEALAIKDELKAAGYSVNCNGRSSQIKESNIIGYNTQITPEIIKSMKKKIPEISRFNYIHNPVRSYCNTSDIVITIKDDE